MAADGSVVVEVGADTSRAETELNKLTKDIEKNERDLNKKRQERLPIAQQLEEVTTKAGEASLKIEEMKRQLEEAQSAFTPSGAKGFEDISLEQFEQYQIAVNELPEKIKQQETEYQKLNSQVEKLNQKVNKYDIEISASEETLRAQTEEAGRLAAAIDQAKAGAETLGDRAGNVVESTEEAAENTDEMADGIAKADNWLDKFTKRVVSLAKRVFIFTVITKALRALKTWLTNVVKNVVKSDESASAAMAQLKAALLTLAQPLVSVIIPAFTKLVQILSKVVTFAAKVVSVLFGSTLSKSAKAAKALYEEQKALEGVGGAADDAAGSLAGFDEVNTIQTENKSGGGGGAAPDFAGLADVELGKIAAIVGGALLALGAILTFSGINAPLGLALMAAGALTLIAAAKENWDTMEEPVKNALIGVLRAVGEFFLALGLVLALSGVAIHLGLALMAIGAVALAGVASLDWEYFKTQINSILTDITLMLGVFLLAIGAILAFSHVNVPLGIALMAAGAVSLAAYASLNWNAIKDALQGQVGIIAAIIGGSLLVLGIILLFATGGTAAPLALGLIVAGAGSLAAAIAPNWNFLVEKVKGVWQSIKDFWNSNIAPVFTSEFWKTLATNAINGLIDGFWSIFDFLSNWVSNIWNYISGFFSNLGQSISNFFSSIFGGGGTQSMSANATVAYSIDRSALPSIPVSAIPHLAKGAVIPQNREFMAVLGDNKKEPEVVSPLSTMKQAMLEALQESGGAGGNRPAEIKIYLDKRVLARVMVGEINDMTIEAGRSVLKI